MEVAFASFVRWAWDDPETRRAFEADTGLRSADTPMDALVDDATGYGEHRAEAFVRWVAENVWGDEPGSGRTEGPR